MESQVRKTTQKTQAGPLCHVVEVVAGAERGLSCCREIKRNRKAGLTTLRDFPSC